VSQGSSSQVMSQIKSLGTDILTINITDKEKLLEYNELSELTELEGIIAVAPYKNLQATVSRGKAVPNRASVMATDENYLDLRNIKIEAGRTFSYIDIENQTKVCIIGASVKESLFNLADPIGEVIKINGDEYTVIGELEEQGSSMGVNLDNLVMVPISLAKSLGSDSKINNIYVKITDEKNIDGSKTVLENYIMRKLQITKDYYSVTSQAQMLEAMNSINSTFALLLGGIASISLVVGGIGVMNVMLVSVTERTKEIGIRKALGAKRGDILFQFLIEALVLSGLGGILGVIVRINFG